MPHLVKLLDEEKEWPINYAEDIAKIMCHVLSREVKYSNLPPAKDSKLNDELIQRHERFQLHSVLTTGENLLANEIEYFWTLGLRADLKLAFMDLIAVGNLTGVLTGIPEAFRGFGYYNVPYAVFVHNHPGGGLLEFSPEDIAVTKSLIKFSKAVGRKVQECLVINEKFDYCALETRLPQLEEESRLELMDNSKLTQELIQSGKMVAKLAVANNEQAEIITQKETALIESALALLKMGLPVAEVAAITQLSPQQVNNLKK